MHDPPRIAIFLSGRGSNARAILDAIDAGQLHATVPLIISNSAKAIGLELAQTRGIPGLPLNPSRYPSEGDYATDLLQWLRHHEIDVVVLAGYLKRLPSALIAAFPERMLNIHPSLLPAHGGPGMYGLSVHAAVLASGATETGVSIHVVTDHYDEGPVIAQSAVPVWPDDTPSSLAARVLAVEHRLYPYVIGEVLDALKTNRPLPSLGRVEI